jgi:hypothetical protein
MKRPNSFLTFMAVVSGVEKLEFEVIAPTPVDYALAYQGDYDLASQLFRESKNTMLI